MGVSKMFDKLKMGPNNAPNSRHSRNASGSVAPNLMDRSTNPSSQRETPAKRSPRTRASANLGEVSKSISQRTSSVPHSPSEINSESTRSFSEKKQIRPRRTPPNLPSLVMPTSPTSASTIPIHQQRITPAGNDETQQIQDAIHVSDTPASAPVAGASNARKGKRPPALSSLRFGVALDEEDPKGKVESSDQSKNAENSRSKTTNKNSKSIQKKASSSGTTDGMNQGAIFRDDGAFEASGFLICRSGITDFPAALERRLSSGASTDGVARSPHSIVHIGSLDELRMVKNIGMGASGRVYLAELASSSSTKTERLAVKVVNVYDEPKRNQLMKELETLSTYISRYLVRFYGAFYDGTGFVHIALEYMDCGALSDIIAEFGALPEAIVQHIAFHCVLGLRFLHRSHVLHRDFKTANILVSQKANRVKLSDFGLARDLELGVSKADTFVGTLAYMSPERLHGSQYTYEGDIWGLGVCLAECLLGRYPFEKPQSFFDYLDATMTENLLPRGKFTKECEDFVRKCANVDPRRRPRTDALLQHPWLASCPRDNEFREWIDKIVEERNKRV